MHNLAKLDLAYLWHPFTQMQDWLKREPLVITSGRGAVLRDVHGKEYLDANSSIWTNLHGHGHPRINAALQRQLKKISHSSALGFANEPASLLGARLIRLANASMGAPGLISGKVVRAASALPEPSSHFERVFFSDDGSTAMEVALKLAYQYSIRSGRSARPTFVSLGGAYHGDTVGAVSLGHIDLFHKAYAGLLFKSEVVPGPYCYRCRFNRAKPERADARDYRQCRWECLEPMKQTFRVARRKGHPVAALVVEPLLQGAAGMIAQPSGWLRRADEIARTDGAQLIADEVMTGFGRTGRTFACQTEGVQPDYLSVAKGLTGGYLPMAATLTTRAVFEAFLGEYQDFKTFFHGHSFTGNQLGAAAALASLDLLESPASSRARQRLASVLQKELGNLWELPTVGYIRQVGTVAGIELVRDWQTKEPFPLEERVGIRVCEAMAQRAVLTRPVGNVIVLIPPYCTTPAQARQMVHALAESVAQVT